MTAAERKELELDIFLLIAGQDPSPVDVLNVYSAFIKRIDMTTFKEAVDDLVLSGKLREFGWNVRYLELSERSRKKIREDSALGTPAAQCQNDAALGFTPGAEFDPLDELLFLVDCVINRHTARTEYVN